MNKRSTIFIILILLIIAGGVFWWQSGKKIRELNKSLPEGIRVEKRAGKQVVVNKKDNYKIILSPKILKISKVKYDFRGETSILNLNDRIDISCFELTQPDINLENWEKKNAEENKATIDIAKQKIGNLEVFKVTLLAISGEKLLPSPYADYLFKTENKVFRIRFASEKEARYIIENGKWSF